MLDVTLTTATEDDVPFLISCNNDVQGMRMLGYSFRVAPDTFKGDMYSWHVFQIIRYGDTPIGFVKANVDIDERNASVSMYLIPKTRNKGVAYLVILPFLTTLFEAMSLHKVSFGIWECNKPSLNNFKHFNHDAVIREDMYYQGKYWDKHVYSCLDREWPQVKVKLQSLEERARRVMGKRMR